MRVGRALFLTVMVALLAAAPACEREAAKEWPAGVTLKGHSGRVNAVAFSPDGSFVVSGGADGTVRVWDSATGECREVLEGHRAPVAVVAVSPNGKGIASGSLDGAVRVWSATTGVLLWSFTPPKAPPGRAPCLAFSPDTRYLATGHATGLLALYDLPRGKLMRLAPEPDDPLPRAVTAVAFTPDGAVLASATEVARHGEPVTGRIAFWHRGAAEPRPEGVDAPYPVDAMRVSADGAKLLVMLRAGYIGSFEMPDCQRRALVDHGDAVHSVSWSSDARAVASASATALRIWEPEAKSLKTVTPPEGAAFEAMALSLDGTRMALATGRDGCIDLRDVADVPGETGEAPKPEDGEDYGDPEVIEKQIAHLEGELGTASAQVASAEDGVKDALKQLEREDVGGKQVTDEVDWDHPDNVGKDPDKDKWDPWLTKKQKDTATPRASLYVNQPSPAAVAQLYQQVHWKDHLERRIAALKERLRRAKRQRTARARNENAQDGGADAAARDRDRD